MNVEAHLQNIRDTVREFGPSPLASVGPVSATVAKFSSSSGRRIIRIDSRWTLWILSPCLKSLGACLITRFDRKVVSKMQMKKPIRLDLMLF